MPSPLEGGRKPIRFFVLTAAKKPWFLPYSEEKDATGQRAVAAAVIVVSVATFPLLLAPH